VLRRDGRVLPLGDRALDILTYLADRPGEVIAKHELMDHIWSDVTVEEGSLRVDVAAIRKALGDGQFGNRYIANVKGRGYSFVGTVAVAAGHDANVRLIAALVHALKARRVDPSGTVWVMVSTIPVDSTSSDTTCPYRRVD
jgi:DNA-binding winged helix-turn-helix (wHTH) protein